MESKITEKDISVFTLVFSIVVMLLTVVGGIAFGQQSKWVDINDITDAIARSTSVPIGGDAWRANGAEAWAGNTGGQGSYGKRKIHELGSDIARRAALANALARATFYLHDEAIAYQASYEFAGRPKGWLPRWSWDLSNGRRRWIQPRASLGLSAQMYEAPPGKPSDAIVDVTGIEAMHWWPTQLTEIAQYGDAMGWTVTLPPWGTVPAAGLAKQVAALQAQTVVGEVVDPFVAANAPNERFCARLIEGSLRLRSAGAILQRDIDRVAAWAWFAIAKDYGRAPGMTTFVGERSYAVPPITTSTRRFALIWQIGWMGEALSDLCLEAPELSDQLRPIARRQLRWLVDAVDANGAVASLISFDAGVLEGWTKPPEELLSLVQSGKAIYHREWPFEAWEIRALRVAERENIPGATAARQRLEAAIPKTTENVTWAVGADWNYLWPGSPPGK